MRLTNNLTEDQLEVLGLIQEEAAEVIQIMSKVRRVGVDFKPNGGELSTIQLAVRELTDLIMVIELASNLGLFDEAEEEPEYEQYKKEKLKQWTNLPHSLIESI